MIKKTLLLLLLGFSALVFVSYLGSYSSVSHTTLASRSGAPDLGGKIAFSRSGAIWMYAGGKAQQLTKGPADRADKRDVQPSFSPDGTELAYTRMDEGFSDIYVLSVDSPASTHALTNNRPDTEVGFAGAADQPSYSSLALWALYPTWAPNGERLAYTSDVRTEYPGLFSMGLTGSDIRKLSYLDHSQQTVERPAYSPNGRKIAVANYLTRTGKGQIEVLDTDTEKFIELTDAKDGAYDPAWSPDGEWIAFTMREDTRNNIYVVPTDAQKWTDTYPTPIKLTNDDMSRSPAWSPDGAHLAYISLKNNSFDIHAADFTVGNEGTASLTNSKQLTDNLNIDAASGLSWGQ